MMDIFEAAIEGAYDRVEELLDNGLDVNIQGNNYGQTPLYWASLKGQTAIVKLLLEKGANMDLQDNDGRTALHNASYRGHTAIVKLLLEKGANVNLQHNTGTAPLHWAIKNSHEEIVDLLTRHEQIKEWRPWNHSDLPQPFREGMTNLMLLAKMIYK